MDLIRGKIAKNKRIFKDNIKCTITVENKTFVKVGLTNITVKELQIAMIQYLFLG